MQNVNTTAKISYLNDFLGLATTAYENAKAKGFWNEPRTKKRAYALIITELYEAYDAVRNGKISPDLQQYANRLEFYADLYRTDGTLVPGHNFENAPEDAKAKAVKAAYEECIKGSLAEELSDVVIRLGDTAKGYSLNFAEIASGAALYEREALDAMPEFKAGKHEVEDLVLSLNGMFMAGPLLESSTNPYLTESHNLGQALRLVYFFAEVYAISLDKHIDLKAEYNRGRAYLHGKSF